MIDLKVVKEEVLCDDGTLVKLYDKSYKNFESRKTYFLKKLGNFDKNDYLSFAVAKLAYEFAKEEYDSLSYEAKKRGLII